MDDITHPVVKKLKVVHSLRPVLRLPAQPKHRAYYFIGERGLPVDADVAKLVDARDLKSLTSGYTGSIPVVRTNPVLSGPSHAESSAEKTFARLTIGPKNVTRRIS